MVQAHTQLQTAEPAQSNSKSELGTDYGIINPKAAALLKLKKHASSLQLFPTLSQLLQEQSFKSSFHLNKCNFPTGPSMLSGKENQEASSLAPVTTANSVGRSFPSSPLRDPEFLLLGTNYWQLCKHHK